MMKKNIKIVIHELKHHIPFTFGATLIAIILVVIVLYATNLIISESLFKATHFAHLFASAVVSTAIFYKYKDNFIMALLIGVTGALVIGSLSDIIVPYLGARLFLFDTQFDLPLIEQPIIVLLILLSGGLVGISTKITKIPHFIHIFLSVFASLFYLLLFSSSLTPLFFLSAFISIFIAVLIPCCLSDIVLPPLFLGNKLKQCKC